MDPSPRSRPEAKLAVPVCNSPNEKAVQRIDALFLEFRRFANSLSLKFWTQSETDDLTLTDGFFCKAIMSIEVESIALNPVTNITSENSYMIMSTPYWPLSKCAKLTLKPIYRGNNFFYKQTPKACQ
jgi:hypothetical protein